MLSSIHTYYRELDDLRRIGLAIDLKILMT